MAERILEMKLDKRLLNLIGTARQAIVTTILLGLAIGILVVIQARLVSQTVNQVFLEGVDLAVVRPILLWLMGVILLRSALVWGSEMAGSLAAVRIKAGLRQKLFDHILSLGPAYTRQERAGELANTCQEGIDALDAYFSQYLPQLVGS